LLLKQNPARTSATDALSTTRETIVAVEAETRSARKRGGERGPKTGGPPAFVEG
jgi:hypothetical protein